MPLGDFREGQERIVTVARNRAKRVILIAAAMVLGFALLEAYARLIEWVGYGSEITVENVTRDRQMLEMLQAGEDREPSTAPRILVLGDSMAYAPGIPYEEVWSTRLGEKLRAQVDPRAEVISAARPGGNTWSQLEQAQHLIPTLRPNIVLLMYNYNDVFRSDVQELSDKPQEADALQDKVQDLAAGEPADTPQTADQAKKHAPSDDGRTFISKLLIGVRKHSAALNGMLPRVTRQFKAWGIILPGSTFYNLTHVAYRPQSARWKEVQQLLLELRDLCTQYDARLVVYVMPQFDSLTADLFSGPNQTIAKYLESIDVPFRIGHDTFKGHAWQEYAVSPFDSHPNLKANATLAEDVFGWLRDEERVRLDQAP